MSEGTDHAQYRQKTTQLTQDAVEQLLHVSLRAARAGNEQAARAVLRALTRQQPDEPRAWLHLAELAESEDEQRSALQHVLLLEPDHAAAQRALEQLPAPAAAPLIEQESGQPARPGWLYLALIGFGLFVLALWALILLTDNERTTRSGPPATAVLPGQVGMLLLTDQASATVTIEPRQSITLVPPATATLLPLPTLTVPAPLTPLPLNTILEHEQWQATLRPDYVQVLEGTVGNLHAAGRFVLVLPVVGNRSDVSRSIPPDLFLLIDAQGRSYRPVVTASRTYLQMYGPSRGDLAIDDPLPPGGSLYSVPLIFDVSPDATGLVLTMGQPASQGWRISD